MNYAVQFNNEWEITAHPSSHIRQVPLKAQVEVQSITRATKEQVYTCNFGRNKEMGGVILTIMPWEMMGSWRYFFSDSTSLKA